jgi:hypothetical protein
MLRTIIIDDEAHIRDTLEEDLKLQLKALVANVKK